MHFNVVYYLLTHSLGFADVRRWRIVVAIDVVLLIEMIVVEIIIVIVVVVVQHHRSDLFKENLLATWTHEPQRPLGKCGVTLGRQVLLNVDEGHNKMFTRKYLSFRNCELYQDDESCGKH